MELETVRLHETGRNTFEFLCRSMRSTRAIVKMMKPKPSTVSKGAEPSIADIMTQILTELGEDPNREGLQRTPERVEGALRYLTQGYSMDASKDRQWRSFHG